MKTTDNSRQRPDDEADAGRMHRYLLGVIELAEFEQLEKDMLASPDLRQRFIRAVRLDAVLRDESIGAINVPPLPQVHAKPGWLQFTRSITALAAVLMLGVMAIWRLGPDSDAVATSAPVTVAEEIATFVDDRGCQWADNQAVAINKRLSNSTLELVKGVAVIEFDGGARLALEGPATLELLGPKTARLHRGNATVRCEEGLYNFSLLTPTSTVVDLGTEFGVAVDPEGSSEVHVLDGAVEVLDSINKFQPSIRFLNEGQTLKLASSGGGEAIQDTTQSWIRDYSSPADRSAGAAPPRLFARDNFPVTPRQPKRFAMGTGWNGSWWQASEAKASDHRFVPMAPLVKRDGSEGMAMFVGGWTEVRRVLSVPIDPVNSPPLYVAFSMQRLNSTSLDKSGRLSEATFLLRSSADPTGVLGLGLSGLNYWVVAEKGGWERSERPTKGNGPFFVVAKIEFHPVRGTKVSMAAFNNADKVPDQEPDQWSHITQRQHTVMTAPLDTVALRVRHTAFKFGEIALGNSWQAVVDPSVTGP